MKFILEDQQDDLNRWWTKTQDTFDAFIARIPQQVKSLIIKDMKKLDSQYSRYNNDTYILDCGAYLLWRRKLGKPYIPVPEPIYDRVGVDLISKFRFHTYDKLTMNWWVQWNLAEKSTKKTVEPSTTKEPTEIPTAREKEETTSVQKEELPSLKIVCPVFFNEHEYNFANFPKKDLEYLNGGFVDVDTGYSGWFNGRYIAYYDRVNWREQKYNFYLALKLRGPQKYKPGQILVVRGAKNTKRTFEARVLENNVLLFHSRFGNTRAMKYDKIVKEWRDVVEYYFPGNIIKVVECRDK